MNTPHVVIVGAGFGGLACALTLAREGVRVTLVDKQNHHLFQPLLYQVATAALAPSDIAEPIRGILRGRSNVEVRLAEVVRLDVERKCVSLVDRSAIDVPDDERPRVELAYDHLVLATGMTTSYFGHPEWARHAPSLKTLTDALDMRRRILSAFEQAEWASGEERAALCTFVVVGGGPTGVELAGAVAEIAERTLRRDFRHLDTRGARVLLIEGQDGVLSGYSDRLRRAARRQLESLGVEVRLNTLVEHLDDRCVRTSDGETIATRTVLWAAGVKATELGAQLGVERASQGRIPVGDDLTVPGQPDVFVIGDLAYKEQDGEVLPGVAAAALQMGHFAGKAIARQARGKARGRFRYVDRGSMATIGRSKAVMSSFGIELDGFPAWLAWAFVHLFFLVGYRNRVLVFAKWAWAWALDDRASRLFWPGSEEASASKG